MAMNEAIPVEVVYATPERQYLWQGEVARGTGARAAVALSDMAARFPDVDFQTAPLGISGKKCRDDAVLVAWDRVEIYRPLLIDPKENRRRRAQQK